MTAVADSISAGFTRDHVRVLPKAESAYRSSLGDMALPDEDRYAHAEGMNRGE